MIKNNINQFEVKGKVMVAPATNHLIQSISHKETGDLIIYTNRIFLSNEKSTNSFIDFVLNHLIKEDRRILIISPSKNDCEELRMVVEENLFDCVSIYYTNVFTTNYVIEKNNVLFGGENFLEHSATNCPSFTIKDGTCRQLFIKYSNELFSQSYPVVKHDFDRILLK